VCLWNLACLLEHDARTGQRRFKPFWNRCKTDFVDETDVVEADRVRVHLHQTHFLNDWKTPLDPVGSLFCLPLLPVNPRCTSHFDNNNQFPSPSAFIPAVAPSLFGSSHTALLFRSVKCTMALIVGTTYSIIPLGCRAIRTAGKSGSQPSGVSLADSHWQFNARSLSM